MTRNNQSHLQQNIGTHNISKWLATVYSSTNTNMKTRDSNTLQIKQLIEVFTCLYWVTSAWRALLPRKLVAWEFWSRKSVTGKFRTSCLQTSHVLLPFMLNHFMAHSWWARASSPLQLHSILSVSGPSPSSTKQIRHTASSSGISSPPSSLPSEPQD